MTVLQNVIKKLQSVDFEKKHPICHQAYQPFVVDSSEGHGLDLQPSDKMIPYQQLWQDVVQNLQKGAESQQFIAMTRSEVDHLDEKLHGEQVLDSSQTSNCPVHMRTLLHKAELSGGSFGQVSERTGSWSCQCTQ